MQLPFAKLECVGNDFVLVETDHVRQAQVRDLGALARFACDRRFGIGSDGLLVLSPNPQPVLLRMFNPDGTEDVCGNGTRCAVFYGVQRGHMPDLGKIHHGRTQIGYRLNGQVVSIQTAPATFDPYEVPHTLEEPIFDEPYSLEGIPMRISALSTGSTHLVVQVENHPPDTLFKRLSSQIEHWPIFPARTSVIWIVIETPNRLHLRIWERGVGETLGCGTGATAAAVVSVRLQQESSSSHRSSADPAREPLMGNPPERSEAAYRIEAVSKGGTLLVELDDWRASPTISGEVKMPFCGTLLLPSDLTKPNIY
jgi:diaminopimelate epimerase